MQHYHTSKFSVDVPASVAEKIMHQLHEMYLSEKEIGTLELEGIVTIHNVGLILGISWDSLRFEGHNLSDTVTVTVQYVRKPFPKQNL